MHDIPSFQEVKKSVYADDIKLWLTGDDLLEVAAKLQESIDQLSEWCEANDLVISASKSATMVFTRRKFQRIPYLTIDNVDIKLKSKHTYLGLTLDAPLLNWKEHIQYLTVSCTSRLNIMKSLAGTSWGCSRRTLQTFYIAYIRSKINYGSAVYSSASQSLLKKISIIQSHAARIITGAWRSTPIPALNCELGLLPIQLHRDAELAILYCKYKQQPYSHPILQLINNHLWENPVTFCHKVSFPQRAVNILEKLQISENHSFPNATHLPIPPWRSLDECIFTDLLIPICKDSLPSLISYLANLTLEERFKGAVLIFTDGSRSSIGGETCSGASTVVPQTGETNSWRLDGTHSVVSTELFALLQALRWIKQSNSPGPFTIATDSMVSLKMLTSRRRSLYPYLVNKILIEHCHLSDAGKEILFQWVPGHAGILGNELADKHAKNSLLLNTITEFPLSAAEQKSIISECIFSQWQTRWNLCIDQ